jgi:hypothetical protein
MQQDSDTKTLSLRALILPEANGDKSGAWLSLGQPISAKREKNPSTARQRSATEKAKYAHKCATAGNVSKACKKVCQEMIPACSDTVEKLRDLHPERSLNLNLENLPTHESLNGFWDGRRAQLYGTKFSASQKFENIFAIASAWCNRHR